MKRSLKVSISILLCFLMLFAEMMPVGTLTARVFAESSVNNEVQDPAEIGEIDDYSSIESVLDSVYNIEEESEENSEEESLGILNPSKAVLLESTSSGDNGNLNEYVISGTVFLPEGYVAPKNGLNLRIYAQSSRTNSVNVTIPEGENKVDYSVIVPGEDNYKIYYQVSNPNYVSSGYYSESGTVRTSSAADTVQLTQQAPVKSDINLTLIDNKIISGEVFILDGVVSAGGLSVTVKAECGSDRVTKTVTIPEGGNFAEYELLVPPNAPGKGYLVSYQTSDKAYLGTAYYNKDGSVRYDTLATLVDVSSNNKEGININLISKKKISGTVSLPKSVAPKNGVTVTLNAVSGSDKSTETVTIPEGTSSVEYSLYVPEGTGYKVYYTTTNEAYFSTGYYNNSGTVKDEKAATLIDTVSKDSENINVELIANYTVSGTVSLPGIKANENIVVEVIVASNSSKIKSTTVVIPAGGSEASYSMYVPTGSGYNVSYKTKNSAYVEQGYYKEGSTVRYLSSASLISVDNKDIDNINLTLIEKRTISGLLSMPSGKAPRGGISFEVTAYNGSQQAKTTVTIEEGKDSVPYSISVPADEGYIIKCKLLTLQAIYMNEQYYSSGGTVYNVDSASTVSTISGNQPNINIMLLEKRTVSGTLSFPSGFVAPEGGITFVHETDGRITYIEFEEGQSSAPFTIYYNPGKFYLYYECYEDDIFVSPGYYSKGGTVLDKSSADLIDVTEGNQVGIDLKLLLKKTISGKVVLPKGVAPAGGYNVTVRASGTKGKAEQTVRINPGEKEADYILFVNPGDKYSVWYETNKEYNYVSPMYYNSDGMVRDQKNASLLDLRTESKTDIDLTLTEMRSVSGNIVLPSGVATGTGINVDVVVTNGKDTTNISVTIPGGSSFANYTAYVPAGHDYKVRYEVDLKSNYATGGYYGVSGTTLNASSAALLDLTLDNKNEINMTLIPKRTISGTVSLPSGMTFDKDTKVTVYAGNSYSTSVTIPSKQTSVSYSVMVPPNSEGSGYKVYYKLSSSTVFITTGYFNSGGMTAFEDSAELVDVSNSDGKADLVLIPKSSISGVVKLPEGSIAPSGGLKVTVNSSNSKNKGSVVVTIPEGKSSAPYTLYVPSGTGYLVEYKTSDEEYCQTGYYSKTGTVKEANAATLLDVNESGCQNIDLELIKNKKITGIFRLPKGVAPAGGFKANLIASNGSNSVKKSVTIPQGYSSVSYTLYVPEGKNYTVRYETTDRSVMPTGYYSDGGMTVDKSKAKLIDASIDVSSINIDLIPKITLRGNVKLSSAPAPAGGISVKLTIDNKVSKDSLDVLIPEGLTSAPYELYVPAGENYVLQYTTSNVGFVSPGYYSESGTKEKSSEASLLNILNDREGLDITLITKRTIRGMIMLPEGYAPAAGVKVTLTAQSAKDKIIANYTIGEGENSVPYTLYVSSDQEYIVKYETTDEKYVSLGYYNVTGTTRDESKADRLDTTETDKVGINIKLIGNRYISGSVSVPSGIAPFGGIKVRLRASNGKDSREIEVVIPEVSSSTNYKLYVPEGKDYELSYRIVNPDGKYLTNGYYNADTATRERGECVLIDLSGQNKEGINITLIPNRLVTGNILLPSGVAPSGGLKITVTAQNNRDSVSTQVIMPQGSSSIVYRMYLPEGENYTIGYTISHEDYLSGYYNVNNTVLNKSEATTFNVRKNDVLGINITVISKRTIKGVISLPEGMIAPAGGIDVTVSAGSYSTKVTIPQNKSTVLYTLKVSPNAVGSGYTVKYTISSSFDFVSTGYYGEEKTVAGSQTASLIDVSMESKTGIDLTILNKRLIKGVFELGSGVAPSGGINVTITAEGRSAEARTVSFQDTVNIPFGQNMTTYELKVDPSYFGSGYTIKYTMNSAYGYAETGYYSDKGTVQNQKDATPVDVYENDREDINIVAISKNHISGIVSLPEGRVAPGGGIKLSVIADNGKDSGSVDVTIPEGEIFAEYLLVVPPGTGYKLYYSVTPNNNYVTNGYFSKDGTVTDPKKAELFEVSDNIAGKNIVLIAKRKISGEILLPPGEFAPVGGLRVEVFANNGINSDSMSVYIPENGSSQNFELYMPPENGYRLYYTLSSTIDYVNKGYFAGNFTVLEEKDASVIDLSNKDLTDATMRLIRNSVIEGNVILPVGSAGEGGIEVRITANNGKYTYSTDVLIPEGSSSKAYSLAVSPAAGYTVSYQVSTGLDYKPKGYYSHEGTVTSVNEASKLDLSSKGEKSIDLTLMLYNSISGTISLPEGVAPDEGVTVTIYAENSRNKRKITVTIPAEKSSTDYTVYVPDGNGYKVYYAMDPNEEYVDKGYYSPNRTVVKEKDCVTLDVIGDSKYDTNLTIIAKRIISGTISLEKGETAPQEGVSVRISAINGDERTVVIPYGKSSASYELKVVPKDSGEGYKIKYETLKNYGYVRYGYYSEDGCVRNEVKAELVEVSDGDREDVNLEIAKLRTIEGKLRLPGGIAATKDMTVSIIASNSLDSAEALVYIPKGAKEAAYSIKVPTNDEDDGYKVRYENWLDSSFADIGYYTQSETVRNVKLAEGVNVRSENVSGIDLTLIAKRNVSGKVSLPYGSAPAGGLTVTVYIENDTDKVVSYVTIPQNQKYANYSINVPVGKNYKVGYEISTRNDFVPWGYYSVYGMAYIPESASLLDVSDNIDGIDLTLIEKKSISGTVSLPEGKAPRGGIKVEIYAEDAGDTWVTIPEGESSAQYSMKVVPNIEGKGYKVRYVVSSEYNLVNYGFYSKEGTVRNSKLADPVNANNKDVTDINIEIMKPRKISGKVTLPEGVAPKGGISLNIVVTNDIDGNSQIIVIPEGGNSAEYSISMPPNDPGYEYRVRYENWFSKVFTTYGYFNSSGTTNNLSHAEPIDVNNKDANNIDMVLLRKATISGNFEIPEDCTLPEEGLNVRIYVSNDVETYSTNIVIPYGTTSVPYSVHVEEGSGYRLFYVLESNDSFIEIGYYGEDGVYADKKKAKVFTVTDENINGCKLGLLEKRKVSGKFTLPYAIDEGLIEVTISASNGSDRSETKLYVFYGVTEVDYTLNLPAGSGYILQYDIIPIKGFASSGYYSESGMARRKDKADALDLTENDLAGMDISLIEDMTISGEIKLPQGVAPEGGIEVTVTATDESGNSESCIRIIKEGESSVEYYLNVPHNNYNSGYKVRYSVTSDNYATIGYYSENGTKVLSDMATLVDVSSENAEDINLMLIEKKVISGIISLPDGAAKEGGLTVTVRASSQLFSVDDKVEVVIPEGESETSYSLKVSPNVEGSDYILFYQVNDDAYVGTGYYNTAGAVVDIKMATPVDVSNGNYSSADISLVKSRKVSGRIALPEGESAPKGGVSVTVFAEKTDYSGYRISKSVLIPEGKNSAEYTLIVPESTSKVVGLDVEVSTDNGTADTADDYALSTKVFIPSASSIRSSDYKVGYSYIAGEKYFKSGFYSEAGTVPAVGMADILDVASKDIEDVDFTLLKKDTVIKGTVKLPEGKTAPKEGISVSITAENDALDYVCEKTVIISSGKSAVDYELEVPSIDGYKIKYTVKSIGGYVTSGYYSENGTVGKKERSTSINCSSGSVMGIDLNLIPGMEIKGKISLPAGHKVNIKDFWMWVVASNENYESAAYVTITEGKSDATYSVYVPEGADYIVYYSLQSLYGEYVEKGYYNSNVTTANKDCATKLNVSKNTSGINLMLIPVDRIISGTVSLPDGMAAVSYSIRVPSNNKGNGYRLGYSVTSGNADGLYYEKGYFSQFGTFSDINDASIIDVSTRNSNDRDMTLMTDDMKPVEAIMLDKYQVTIQSGGELKLNVKHLPENATNKTIKWSTSNNNIAEVSSEGLVKAKASGTAVITAISSNSVMTAFTVKVVPKEEGLSIDKLTISLNPGESEQLHAIFNPVSEDDSVIWTSDNIEVADVTQEGLVTAIKSGSAVITATSTKDSSIVAECSVTVITPVTGIEIDKTELKIKVGYSDQLTAWALPEAASYKGISWSSSNDRIVKVSQSGEVTGVGIGTAVVTARSIYNPSVKVECKVEVVPVPVEKIVINRESVTLYPDDYILLTTDILPLDATDKRVEWKSMDNSIVTVTQEGLVKAVGFGEVKVIAASLYDASKTAECLIKVVPRPVTEVAFKNATEKIYINSSKALEVTILPTNATNKALIWTSSNEDIATVSQSGLVTGKKAGTVQITAAWEDNPEVKAVCTVTIEAIKVLGISLNIKNTSLNVGDNVKLIARITPENATNKEVVWTSSDTKIAKVSSTGMVTAVSGGTVTITATSKEDSKIKAVCTITVKEIMVSSVSLNRRSVTIAVGESITLNANVYPSNSSNKELDWKSNNTSVAQVSSGGVVKAMAVGTAIITVTSRANLSCKDECIVYVEEALPIPTEPVYDPGVIPGAAGGGPIVSIDETPSQSATPTPTPIPGGTSSPAVTQTPTPGNDNPSSIDYFTDIKGHWAAAFFEDLLQKGIVSGYPDRTLRPNAPITRAEATVMVMKAAGFEVTNSIALTCTDKDTVPDWAKAYVATAMYKGVVKGYEDGSFRPSNRLTRQETVVLVLRAFGIEEDQDKTLSFADSNVIPAWSAGYVKKAVELGIIKGYNDNTFGPQREITRAEVVTIISKCMQIKKQ